MMDLGIPFVPPEMLDKAVKGEEIAFQWYDEEATAGFRDYLICLSSADGKPYRFVSGQNTDGFTVVPITDRTYYSENQVMLRRLQSCPRIPCVSEPEKKDFMGWTDSERELYLPVAEERFRMEYQGDFSPFHVEPLDEETALKRYCTPKIYGEIIYEKLRFADTNQGCVTPANLTSPNGNLYHVTIEPYDRKHFKPVE